MQEMNPNYKNYKFLAGIWKNNDGSFTADLTVPENITVTYNGASLTHSFILTQTSTMTFSGTSGFMGMAMMMASSSGMVSKRYDDEDILREELESLPKTLTYKILELQRCPKCKKEFTEHPALSREDNETEVCPECGIKEALEAYCLSSNR